MEADALLWRLPEGLDQLDVARLEGVCHAGREDGMMVEQPSCQHAGFIESAGGPAMAMAVALALEGAVKTRTLMAGRERVRSDNRSSTKSR